MKLIYIYRIFLCITLTFSFSNRGYSQFCDNTVPSMVVDLSAAPAMYWVSPEISREGSCCGSTSPDVCLEFVINLHPEAIAVNFQIASGAVPPGALYYQIDCGPITPVGEPICLTGAGPHNLTFCKPGNNSNSFSVISYSDPIAGPDVTTGSGCQTEVFAEYYDVPSITWTSIYPGIQGTYDSYLSCTAGCELTQLTVPLNPPPYIDFMVCGHDIAGCNVDPVCDVVRVNIVPPAEVDASPESSNICNGDPGIPLTTSVMGGSPPYSYLWNTGDTTSSILGVNGNYIVYVSDSYACIFASDTVVVNQNQIELILSGVDPDCAGSSTGAISSEVVGGIPAYSYQWLNGPTGSNQYNLAEGTYTVTVTDELGCTATGSITLEDPPVLLGSMTADTIICEGSFIELTSYCTGGTGNYNYIWHPTFEQTSSIYAFPTCPTQYSVIVTDDNGCQTAMASNVNVISLNPNDLVANISEDFVCESDTVWISGSYTGPDQTVDLSWMHCPSCPTSYPIPETPAFFTEYILSGTNSCEQTIYDTVSVQIYPDPEIEIAISDQNICENVTIIYTNTGSNDPSWEYYWDFGDGSTSDDMISLHSYVESGSYPISLNVIDEHGCLTSSLNTATVYVQPTAIASFEVSQYNLTMDDPEIILYNNSSNATNFYWTFGDGTSSDLISPTHSYGSPDGYTITLYALNEHGCNDSTELGIIISPSMQFYLPNAFTPDGDGVNEIFQPSGFGISDTGYEFSIYNRWGEVIFFTDRFDEGWNGMLNGNTMNAQDGVYTWSVTIRDEGGMKYRKHGHVSLVR